MAIFLVLQNSYTSLEFALFDEQQMLDLIVDDKARASKMTILHVEHLLKKNRLTLHDISFIAVNQGPGPFTSLRVTIAYANGLSFAIGKPLIGIDGIAALLDEKYTNEWPYTVALMNAFNNDLYYAIQTPYGKPTIGYQNSALLLEQIRNQYADQKIHFIGSGVPLVTGSIQELFGDQYSIDSSATEPSLAHIARIALGRWLKQEHISDQLFPLYLKSSTYKKAQL